MQLVFKCRCAAVTNEDGLGPAASRSLRLQWSEADRKCDVSWMDIECVGPARCRHPGVTETRQRSLQKPCEFPRLKD